MSKNSSRRTFLKIAAAGAAVAVGGALAAPTLSQTPPRREKHPHPGSSHRKWVMVIDLERCDGCHKCTEACIERHLIPSAWGEPSFKGVRETTKPAQPQPAEKKTNYVGRQEWIKVYEFGEDLGPPGDKGNFLPAPCMQCENAPCVNVCPVAATYHDEDGVVLIDHDRCIGCRFCMAACPYERRYFNWGEPNLSYSEEEKAKLAFAQYSPEFPVPHRRGTVEKCMFCTHRTQFGELPACVEACTNAGMKAIFFGDANEDAVSNGVEVLKLSELLKSRMGYKLKEELGTHPRVFYLPPRGR